MKAEATSIGGRRFEPPASVGVRSRSRGESLIPLPPLAAGSETPGPGTRGTSAIQSFEADGARSQADFSPHLFLVGLCGTARLKFTPRVPIKPVSSTCLSG